MSIATFSPLVTDNDGKPMARNPLKDVRVRARDCRRRWTATPWSPASCRVRGFPPRSSCRTGVPGHEYRGQAGNPMIWTERKEETPRPRPGYPAGFRPDDRFDQRSLH